VLLLIRRRYPIKKSEYARAVGRLLPHRIAQILEELGLTENVGFEVRVNCSQANDVDLKIFYRGNVILVAEILNWSPRSRLSNKRKNSITKNLLKYNCVRLLIYTVLDGHSIEYFTKKKICLLEIGYQLLPRSFYNFYKDKNQIEHREIDSKKTKRNIKSKIAQFFRSKVITRGNLILSLLFQPDFPDWLIPLEKHRITKRVSQELESILIGCFHKENIFTIRTREGELPVKEYVRKVIKSIAKFLKGYLKQKLYKREFRIPNILYHGTTTVFLSRIRDVGLLPSETGKNWEEDRTRGIRKVCLTDNLYAAEFYAIIAAKKWGGQPVVLEINVKSIKKLAKIRFEIFQSKRPIDIYREIYFTTTISSKKIKNWYVVPNLSTFIILQSI